MEFEQRLDGYLRARGVEHFRASEICPVGRQTRTKDGKIVRLQPAPERLWENFVRTGLVLEWLRERLGCPIYVTSCYRDPTYNRAVGGAINSLHITFSAADIHTAGRYGPSEIAEVLETHPDAKSLGIGVYERRGFVHVDTRGALGMTAPARWNG